MNLIESNTIKSWGNDIANSFQIVANNGYKSVQQFEIDSNDLEEKFVYEDIRDSDKFRKMFSELQQIENSPCVYVFEVVSNETSIDIIHKIQLMEGKTRPAIKKTFPLDSRILYVGKVKKCAWGRIIMHLGYHTHKSGKLSNSHGLQLHHWATEMGLKLRIHVYEFNEDLADYMEVIEKKFANSLSPIIGKHK
ncbi:MULTISPECIES: hypothetical protein [Sphingobacterium]|uniref:hypothetical protein n=1 Tax=Sphingobacterium TaxID=28453 RepID=UPI00257DD48A|nr:MULTISPECIES: hypothetical protein [Sphingobacterium]